MKLYHGTDIQSAKNLLNGETLDASQAAKLKLDGPTGFFLAFEPTDAEFFALRRGPGAVVEYELSDAALLELQSAGAIRQPIPIGARSPRFVGDELLVPISAFEVFNDLSKRGEIQTTPAS
jgi:hypothetical protein